VSATAQDPVPRPPRAHWPTVRHPFLHGPYPRAFAHRGWHLGELAGMENTLSAFRRAAAEGYRYLETDVRATRDGVVMAQHDATLARTTDNRSPVAELRWADLRRALIGGRERLCRLDELLEELPDALLNIDVKADPAVAPVLTTLQRCDAWHRVCLASFSERRLTRLRRCAGPRLLTSTGRASAAALRLRSLVGFGPPVRGRLAQLPRRRGRVVVVDRALVNYAHRLGMEVHVWTVDRPTEMAELLDLGVDGLVTDRPDELRRVLAERGQWPHR
jgi:glycerophosphoryl diester phosphodiesterase